MIANVKYGLRRVQLMFDFTCMFSVQISRFNILRCAMSISVFLFVYLQRKNLLLAILRCVKNIYIW